MLSRRQCLAGAAASLALGAVSTVAGQVAPPKPPVRPIKKKTTSTTIYIQNMHCEGCAKRLRSRLYKLPGVLKVTTNLKQGVAIVTPSTKKPVKAYRLWDTTVAEKFAIVKMVTPTKVYVKHPKTPVRPKAIAARRTAR